MSQCTKILEEHLNCPICYDSMTDPSTTKCGHNFCKLCIERNGYECAVCRTKLKTTEVTINYGIKKMIESLKTAEKEAKQNSSNKKTEKRKSEYRPSYLANTINIMQSPYLNVNTYRVKRLRSQIDSFSEPIITTSSMQMNIYGIQPKRLNFDRTMDQLIQNFTNPQISNFSNFILTDNINYNQPTPLNHLQQDTDDIDPNVHYIKARKFFKFNS